MTDDSARQNTEMGLARLGAENIANIRPVQIDSKMQFMLMMGDGRELCVSPNSDSGRTRGTISSR